MDKITRQRPQTTTFSKGKGQPKRHRTEVLPLTSLKPHRYAKLALSLMIYVYSNIIYSKESVVTAQEQHYLQLVQTTEARIATRTTRLSTPSPASPAACEGEYFNFTTKCYLWHTVAAKTAPRYLPERIACHASARSLHSSSQSRLHIASVDKGHTKNGVAS